MSQCQYYKKSLFQTCFEVKRILLLPFSPLHVLFPLLSTAYIPSRILNTATSLSPPATSLPSDSRYLPFLFVFAISALLLMESIIPPCYANIIPLPPVWHLAGRPAELCPILQLTYNVNASHCWGASRTAWISFAELRPFIANLLLTQKTAREVNWNKQETKKYYGIVKYNWLLAKIYFQETSHGLSETGLACEAKEDRFCSALYTVPLMHNDVLLSLLLSLIFFTIVKMCIVSGIKVMHNSAP